MDALWAEKMLRECGDLTAESIEKLTEIATGSRRQADRAWCDRKLAERERRFMSGGIGGR